VPPTLAHVGSYHRKKGYHNFPDVTSTREDEVLTDPHDELPTDPVTPWPHCRASSFPAHPSLKEPSLTEEDATLTQR
jgi:hypothetical protein